MRLDHYVRHYGDDARQVMIPSTRPSRRRGVFYPRARTLGGCTAHYAMIIIRPHDSDWQAIRDATGDPSWAPAAMNQYFARVERCHYRDGGSRRSWHGWVAADPTAGRIRPRRRCHPSTRPHDREDRGRRPVSLPETAGSGPGCLEPAGALRREDRPERLAGPGTHGSRPDRGAHGDHENGHRAGTRERIRRPRPPGGSRCAFTSRDRARLRRARPAAGRRRAVSPGQRLYRADRDAGRFGRAGGAGPGGAGRPRGHPSGGAYITPQLLMLSGIGPKEALERVRIDVLRGPPGSGREPAGPLRGRHRRGADQFVPPVRHVSPARNATRGDDLRAVAQGWRAVRLEWRGPRFIARSSVAEHGEPDLFVFGVSG